MSAICRLINSTSKLCRVDERVAKGTFPTLRLEPFDGLVDLLATFRACHFQRQIVEKHDLVQTITKFLELAKLSLIIALIRVLEKIIGRAICTRSMQSCTALRSDSTMKIVTAFVDISSLRASQYSFRKERPETDPLTALPHPMFESNF